ncbi:hypothetical protein KL930_005139 [Ogataea haglerorum]|uniref:uncharacterized protein n=1 Tax=Ogataea haglerorum TaxID=1937702 RepID=UPI001C89DE37|nr:uncharacterized protein KL911_005150 [Ogataea haglerorum]KAG7692201.1 hypothetical protein KL951_005110 [Ogataea haglerorum]KAG7693766.1 hypothetical protein KL915_004056 [Ogataea haglerorum]KAG7713396.1 hypothetical protein KL913_005017 [Ogataea haglerorum]KAG7713892.1 hypothetical protein KL949_005055 [Ogataea haglerorum]KAG7734175.1 hypothetical protein KL932_005039 [Ogataea haglerorum]
MLRVARRANNIQCLARCSQAVLRKSSLSPAFARGLKTTIRPTPIASNLTHRSQNLRTSMLFVRHNSQVVKVPEMAESITEGTLASFAKEVGEYVRQDELIATIETDKIDVEVNAPISGKVTELLVNVDDTVEVGQDLLKIEPGEVPADAEKAEPKKEEPKKEEPKKEEPKKEAPKEETKKEAKKAAPKKEEPKKETSKAATPEKTQSAGKFSRTEERVKMNRMRLRIAERLKESQNTAASLTTFNEVDMSALMEMRKLYKDEILKKTGIKFGFMGAFSKASTLAMKSIPAVNAAIENNDTMVFRDYVDISIAVATPKGLVTPIVRNAESLSVLEIEEAIANLGVRARDGKLTLEDMAGGTFTISNGGVFGSLYGTPIINMPQTAVLGLHGIKERPVAVNGKVEIRPMMYLALTYDHRMLDGREAVTFLKTVKELIEDPRKMLLV